MAIDKTDDVLPHELADLTPFVAKWAKPTEYERAAARRSAAPEELDAFYQAVLPRLPVILERVDAYPLGAVKGVDRVLFHLALALAEVAPHVEFYKSNPNVPFAFREDRMFGVHSGIAD
jgi:hypothetical protein